MITAADKNARIRNKTEYTGFGDKKTSIWQIKSKVAKKAFSLNIRFWIKSF
jgi:hypothetical protein